jgi:hypothetical protein
MDATTDTAPPPSAPGDLRPDGLLASDLWLDREDAPAEIARRLERGEIDEREAAHLETFWRDGYFVFPLEVDGGLFAALDRDVDRLWEEQPPWVAYAYGSLLTRFSGGDGDKRLPASRIADLHEFSSAALELYLQPRLFRYVELILGEPALATQSLYFQWGSQQALHRDPIHVRMTPPTHLVAAWIALEDIQPGCGELRYVPGSHRLPYYELAPGRYTFDHTTDTQEQILAGQQWDLERCAEAGLEPVPLRCRRGECLVWHHSLLHGGSYPSQAEMRGYHGFASPLVAGLPAEIRERYGRAARAEARIGELTGALEAKHQELETARQEIAGMKASRFWKLRDAWWRLRRAVGRG